MRLLHLSSVISAWLFFLPLVLRGLPFLVVLVATIVVWLAVAVARLASLLTGSRDTTPVLHTITYSHYVERVRWAMQRLGMKYKEEQDIGIMGILLQGRTVPRLLIPSMRVSLGDSSSILPYLYAMYQGTEDEEKARFLKPTTEIFEMCKKIDRAFGIYSRRWMYEHILQVKEAGLLVWGAHEERVPLWQRMILRNAFPVLKAILKKMLKVTPSSAERALEKVDALYDELDALLADGRQYIMGDEFTVADITLASLGALTTLPEGYAGGHCTVPLPSVDDLEQMGVDYKFTHNVRKFRQRPTGKLILRLYREERLAAPQPNTHPKSTDSVDNVQSINADGEPARQEAQPASITTTAPEADDAQVVVTASSTGLRKRSPAVQPQHSTTSTTSTTTQAAARDVSSETPVADGDSASREKRTGSADALAQSLTSIDEEDVISLMEEDDRQSSHDAAPVGAPSTTESLVASVFTDDEHSGDGEQDGPGSEEAAEEPSSDGDAEPDKSAQETGEPDGSAISDSDNSTAETSAPARPYSKSLYLPREKPVDDALTPIRAEDGEPSTPSGESSLFVQRLKGTTRTIRSKSFRSQPQQEADLNALFDDDDDDGLLEK